MKSPVTQNKHKLTFGRIHFVGIGGIGMSGIAEVMCNMGYEVSGSDVADNKNVERLRSLGAKIVIGHDAQNSLGAGVVVISSAVKPDNIELQTARDHNIPIVRRAVMLAELMRFKRGIAIAGTHGKTTTTSLVAQLLVSAGYDPTIINGGVLNSINSNAFLGAGDWLVAEADESDGSFLQLPSDIVVVTNIDPEHLDYYGNFDHLKQAFKQFVQMVPFYGFAVMCLDHPVVRDMITTIEDSRIMTYGFHADAMIRADNLNIKNSKQYFDVHIHDQRIDMKLSLKQISISIFGLHNVSNALAAIGVAYGIGIPIDRIRAGLMEFKGVKRRFTVTGEVRGVKIIDDYGHHPVEIKAVLSTARGLCEQRLYAVVQPHRYSRVHDLFDEFARCFQDADEIILAPIYGAGEIPIDRISSESLAKAIEQYSQKPVRLIKDGNDIAPYLKPKLQSGDLIVCLGAGNITKWAHELPEQLV